MSLFVLNVCSKQSGSIAEWLACWTQALKARVQVAAATLSGNSLRQTVHTHCASVHQAAKLVATFLRVAGVTAGLAGSNDSLLPGLWLTSTAGWLSRTGISSGTLRSVIDYRLPLLFFYSLCREYDDKEFAVKHQEATIQLTDDGPVYHALSVHLSRTKLITRFDDRYAAARLL